MKQWQHHVCILVWIVLILSPSICERHHRPRLTSTSNRLDSKVDKIAAELGLSFTKGPESSKIQPRKLINNPILEAAINGITHGAGAGLISGVGAGSLFASWRNSVNREERHNLQEASNAFEIGLLGFEQANDQLKKSISELRNVVNTNLIPNKIGEVQTSLEGAEKEVNRLMHKEQAEEMQLAARLEEKIERQLSDYANKIEQRLRR